MLNKLLKRCMPWMDKGRWYHIQIKSELVVETLSVTDVTFDEPMFSHYETETSDFGPSVKVYFSDPNINASIIDYKAVINANIPGELVSYISSPYDLVLNLDRDTSGYYVATQPMPGVTDMWLFIKTN